MASAAREFPQPSTQCKLQELLGLANFITALLHIIQPLNNLQKQSHDNKQALQWMTKLHRHL